MLMRALTDIGLLAVVVLILGNEYVSPPKLMEWVSWLSYEELIDCFDYWLSDIWSRSVGRCVEHNDWLMGGLKLLSWEWLSFAKWLEDTGGIGGGGLKRVNMGESLSNENYYWGRIDGGWADMFMIKHLFPPLRVQGTVRSIEQELNILETWE